LAQRATRLSGGNNPGILAALAAAEAEVGQFPSAVTTARKALELATAQNNPPVADALRIQIRCYEAGTPFRDSSLTSAHPVQNGP